MTTDTLERPETAEYELLTRLSRDLREAAAQLTTEEVRWLVGYYYDLQEDRIAAAGRVRAYDEAAEPNALVRWLFDANRTLESDIKRALSTYVQGTETGRWATSICGIGPVIGAGLLAHIDISQAPTVGHIWRFAGLDPTVTWEKKTKRPWNAALKRLCWLTGESFVKVSGNDRDVYGQVYKRRKEEEIARNAGGEFADQAAQKLATVRIGKDTDAYAAYAAGKLPPAHIHARAKRYAVKLFLAHYHEVAFWYAYHQVPPKPWILTGPLHTHYLGVPNLREQVPELWEAKRAAGLLGEWER